LQRAVVGDEAAAMRRLRSDGRRGVLLACALLAGCAVVGVEDVPPAAAAAANVAVARDFPGAARVLQGFELAGERALRHGDRVLYGVELARGDVVTRNLLQIEVVAETVTPEGTLRFESADKRFIPARVVRQVAL
jgi:hypothetical protein